MIQDSVGDTFDGLDSAFSRILMLVMRLTLPITNAVGVEDILGKATDFRLGTVTEEHVHGATLPDVVLECTDKTAYLF